MRMWLALTPVVVVCEAEPVLSFHHHNAIMQVRVLLAAVQDPAGDPLLQC